MNNLCLYVKRQKSTFYCFFSLLWKHTETKESATSVLTLWPITAALLFFISFSPPTISVSFFHPFVSGNEAWFKPGILARWQSSACCAWSRAGLCHSAWARLMKADGRGINSSSEERRRGGKPWRRGSPGTLFVGPFHLLAAAGSGPSLTESTGLCLVAQDPLIYGLSSLLLSEPRWPKFCYWQKDEVLFVLLWPLPATRLSSTDNMFYGCVFL